MVVTLTSGYQVCRCFTLCYMFAPHCTYNIFVPQICFKGTH